MTVISQRLLDLNDMVTGFQNYTITNATNYGNRNANNKRLAAYLYPTRFTIQVVWSET